MPCLAFLFSFIFLGLVMEANFFYYVIWFSIPLYGIADDCDTRLHTQLWIDPVEEFEEYVHTGDPVDVTLGLKELKVIYDQTFFFILK